MRTRKRIATKVCTVTKNILVYVTTPPVKVYKDKMIKMPVKNNHE